MHLRVLGLLVAAALFAIGASCASDDDGREAFNITGRVVSVEPAAQPANDPTDSEITGAVVVQAQAPDGCQADANGVRIYVDDDTTFTPTDASADLEKVRGDTVQVTGQLTKDGDTCTAIADAVSAADASASPGDGMEDSTGGGGAGGASNSPGASSAPGATSSPNDPDDEGSIADTEETASPGPDNPDDHGVMDDHDNSGKG